MKKKIIGISFLFGFIALLFFSPVRTFSGNVTGWVKLHPASSQSHNSYTINKKLGTFGGFEATNVKEGDNATDATIPDGEYYVTFWVTGKTRGGRDVVDVEHKKKMRFVGGKMQGSIYLTVDGAVTSAGVSYPE